jgi:hypothetical protein
VKSKGLPITLYALRITYYFSGLEFRAWRLEFYNGEAFLSFVKAQGCNLTVSSLFTVAAGE